MNTSSFTRRDLLVASGVGLVAATGYAALRSHLTRSEAGAGADPTLAFESPEDSEVELTRASKLRAGHNDLTRIAEGHVPASGVPILISGRLVNGFGRPLPATWVELWNANRWGRYAHIHDPSDLPEDPNFAGIGRTMTDSAGRYYFLTIEPGAYRAERGGERLRPAHVHVAIGKGTARRVTEMYFAGDPHLAGDPAFAALGDAGSRQLGQDFRPAIAAAERGLRFDIVTDGPNATFFA